MRNTEKAGRVYLVGAGPGDADLITRRGYGLLSHCDVVVYDNLAPRELVVSLAPHIERINVGKKAGCHTLPQEEINKLLVRLAQNGKQVVRLKGGDPFIFGRGGEEALFLAEHGVPFEIVPGVTAGVAALSYVGIPATHRGTASCVVFVTGHESAESGTGEVPWDRLAQLNKCTLIGYMGVGQLPHIVEKLIESGMSPGIPAVIIERGTLGTQRFFSMPLAELPARAEKEKIKPPALFAIGEAVSLRRNLHWFDDLPLFGRRVMVTRPVEQSTQLYSRLRGLGAEVMPLPTLSTTPIDDQDAWTRLESRTRHGDWLFFASENGVRYFLEHWRRRGKDIRALSIFSIAVVGAGALRALEPAGIHADLVAATPTTTGLAEQMAAQLVLKGRRVIRVRGNLGDERVDKILSSADAEVIPLVVYHNLDAKWEKDDYEWLKQYPPDVFLFSSGSAISALIRILGEEYTQDLTARAITVSIGPHTTKTAQTQGITITVESPIPSLEGMVGVLLRYLNSQRLSP